MIGGVVMLLVAGFLAIAAIAVVSTDVVTALIVLGVLGAATWWGFRNTDRTGRP